MTTVSSISSGYANYLYGSASGSTAASTTTVSRTDTETTSAAELSTLVSAAVSLSTQSALIAGISEGDAATHSAVDLLNSFIAADSSATVGDAETTSTDATAAKSVDTSSSAETTATASISTYA